MLKRINMALLVLPLILAAAGVKGQHVPRLINGTVTEKANIELMLFKRINKKTEIIGDYKLSPDNPDYAFSFEEDKSASYHLMVNVMKQGHRRLEFDKMHSFPLTFSSDKTIRVDITPSQLDSVKKTGLEVVGKSALAGLTRVKGVITNAKVASTIGLGRVIGGKLVQISSYKISVANPKFELMVPVKEEGFYYLVTPRWRARIYLKPSDELEVSADAITGLYTIVKGSEENKWMEKWQNLALPITSYGYNINVYQNGINLDQYIADYEKLQPSIADFKQKNGVENPNFKKLFHNAIDIDNAYAPVYLLSRATARKANSIDAAPRNNVEPPAFYRQFVNDSKFHDAAMLELGEAMQFLELHGKLSLAFAPDRKNMSLGEQMRLSMDAISNDTIKSAFFKEQMEVLEVNNLSEFRETFQPFEKYATTPEAKKKYQQLLEHFIADTAWIGKSSYNFSLPDTKDRMVSMKEFKGKVVFIDVWATWCGPCKEQFPYLKELEEEYKDNKNIVFVGISIDRVQDKDKWLRFIQKEKLPGIQLLDDAGHGFGRKYGINAVPRFLLIDKEGNWIEIRCPRPTDTENLKRYLDKALQS